MNPLLFSILSTLTTITADGPLTIETEIEAIQARTGCFEVKYQFFDHEVPASDFTATATEYIEFEKVSEDTYSLQHVSIGPDPDEPNSPPDAITIHWRELWSKSPQSIFDYSQKRIWTKSNRKVLADQWSYSVFQIDGSLRFQNIGSWSEPSEGQWVFESETRAPMPRRETLAGRPESKRYDVMNRKLKARTTSFGYDEHLYAEKIRFSPEGDQTISVETGTTRFVRQADEACQKAKEHLDKQKPFWNAVNASWAKVYNENEKVDLISGRLIGEFIQMGEKFASGENIESLEQTVYSKISQNLRK